MTLPHSDTALDLAKLRALAEAVKPGQWGSAADLAGALCDFSLSGKHVKACGAFIAAACPAAILALLDELDAAYRALAHADEWVEISKDPKDPYSCVTLRATAFVKENPNDR